MGGAARAALPQRRGALIEGLLAPHLDGAETVADAYCLRHARATAPQGRRTTHPD